MTPTSAPPNTRALAWFLLAIVAVTMTLLASSVALIGVGGSPIG